MSLSDATCLATSEPESAPSQEPRNLSQRFDGLEAALIESRDRILHALEMELAAVRVHRNRTRLTALSARHEGAQAWGDPLPDLPAPPAPSNVVPMSRETFAARSPLPPEAALDAELERATIEELNAALAAAFKQMGAE